MVSMAGGKEHLFLNYFICTLLLHLWSPNIKAKPQEEEQLESRSSGGFSKQCALKVNPLPAFPSSSHPSGSPEVSDGSLTDFSCSQDKQKGKNTGGYVSAEICKVRAQNKSKPKE